MGFATMFDELLCVLLSCFLLTCQTFRERDGPSLVFMDSVLGTYRVLKVRRLLSKLMEYHMGTDSISLI